MLTFAYIAKKVRAKYGLSQYKMGDYLNIDRRCVMFYENNKRIPKSKKILNFYLKEFGQLK